MPSPARRTRLRRALVVLVALVLTAPLAPALAAPLPATETQEQARQRERSALADLENSTEEVRAAAGALRSVTAALPRAPADVARARGELAGARARVAAANAAVARAEAARAEAQQAVAQATGRVEQGREDVAQLARRAYQRGRLGDLREVMEAGEPQDALERASMLRKVFAHQDSSLTRLTRDRLSLARTEKGLAAQERAVTRAREAAQSREQRARAVAVDAEQAAARVVALQQQRTAALAEAEQHRAADQREYQQAQEASRLLAERIREAARKAAEAERRRKEAEARAAEEARRRAERANQPPPRPRRQAAPSEQGDDMLWPCGGCPLTSRYGWRTHPIYGDRRFHAGIDMGAGIGHTVKASDAGTVTYAGYAQGYGTLVVVSHGIVGGRDLSTAYAHMGRISVSEGQRVARGQKVGEVGNEGNSTGPHLHFEVRRNGDPVDPLDWVDPP